MPEDLKPCPFCGTAPRVPDYDRDSCGCDNVRCPLFRSMMLIEAWNTRATPAPAPVTVSDDLLERLSAIEHEQWMAWASTVAEKEPISDERRKRWMSCMVPYSQLSEEMKEHDRVWARKVLEAYESARGSGK